MTQENIDTGYPMIKREDFFSTIDSLLSPIEIERIETAYIFAKYGHRSQYRDDGVTRYFEHPRAVAWIIIKELKLIDWQTIVLALLHDIKEDSYILSWNRIQINFGRQITIDLKLLTKDPKEGYLERIFSHGSWRVLLVKLCDRLHNLRTLDKCEISKKEKQIAETIRYYLPLCDILIAKLKKGSKWRGEYLKEAISRCLTK